jgi:hypothetical protein
MNVGMLWFDNDSKADLTTKLNRAVSYYQNKYGQRPNLCFVHPTMLKDSPSKEGDIEVRTTRSVRPNHFWLGVNGNGAAINL